MAWFMRGVQSAVFHYASCAPCTGYADGRRRRKAAKLARKARERLELEQPEAYHHPEPTGTNPYWDEEIAIGPGPPPRRARRTNGGSTRNVTTAGTQGSAISKAESSFDGEGGINVRLSDDTLGNDHNWNRRRYQREDEHLWGHDETPTSLEHTSSGSSAGMAGFSQRRPGTSRSGSYYSARAPPVNDLHPPVVSLPSPDPADNRWMLQPPPKASVMAGKERASNRSRSGSGASSRVELALGRQVSTRQMMHKLERGETIELPPLTPTGSCGSSIAGQRHDRSRMPLARPPSATSSRGIKRRDTAMTNDSSVTRTDTISSHHSSGGSSDTVVRGIPTSPPNNVPDIKIIRVRQSRPALSTVVSASSGENIISTQPHRRPTSSDENAFPSKPSPVRHRYTSAQSSDSAPYLMSHRAPISTSDVSSLNCLQDLVSPRALLNSRFVSAPLVEAKIRLPPSTEDMASRSLRQAGWAGSGFAMSRGWGSQDAGDEDGDEGEDEDEDEDYIVRAPFDYSGHDRDPRLRWSVDF
ncbi:hypothetical protein ACN47E_009876 [Coniothyrium glycines]